MKLIRILFFIVVLMATYSNGYCIDEAAFRKQLEQKIGKIKKDTPVYIKHWDGTEFYITFVENDKDFHGRPTDVIWVRVWGEVLPMEKAFIEEIKKR